jgi:hypothetical protein
MVKKLVRYETDVVEVRLPAPTIEASTIELISVSFCQAGYE